MESNSKTDLKGASTPSDSDSSDLDENDDAFFNELFTNAAPTYEAADTAPWLDDSDTEISSDATVKFYINDLVAVAEIAGTRHRIGFLDLTDEEHSCLGAISETTVEMSVNEKYILMQNQKFNIKRIQEYENTVSSHQKQMESSFEELNLHRIQFSRSEPFLAKYQNDIYFVGKRLCSEYLLLLSRTKKQPGISMRINKKRLCVDRLNQVLDVKQAIDFKKPNEICIIADTNESSSLPSSNDDRPSNGYRRFIMLHSSWTLLEVEANLIHSSVYDVGTEIYAEIDFPFTESKLKTIDDIQPQPEKLSRKERKHERALKHEEKKEKNEKKKQIESNKNSSKSSSFSSPEVANKSNVEKKHDTQGGKTMRTLVFSNSSQARNEPIRSENGPFKMEDLKPYDVTDDVKEYFKTGAPLLCVDRTSAMTDKSLENRMVNYLIASDLMIELEEAEHERYLEKFVQKSVRLTYCGENQFSFLLNDELSEVVAEIEKNSIEYVILRPTSLPVTSNHKSEHLGKICDLQDKKVLIDVMQTKSFNLIRGSCENKLYDISFKLNRLNYQLQHYALEFILDHELFVRLIDSSDYRSSKPSETKRIGAKANHLLRNCDGTQLERLNEEQYSALINILFSSKTQLPYLLIGPPGTGKTHTLVALIEQIVRTTNQNVLFCAPTNNACDEMTYHLTRILQAGELYRFYATSSKVLKSKPHVLDVSNFTGTTVSYPPLNTLYKYRVVICTLESAGFLTRARIDRDWNGQNFKYVIIDDSSSVPETMTFISIAGLCTSNKKIHAKVILSGDLKQLGPLTRSNIRIEKGYNKSWLAHLSRTKLYSRNEETGKLNDSFITYLNKNYRSHPQILHIPNELFYENTMQSSAEIDDVGWYLNTSLLPSKQFPLIFKAVQGSCQRAIGYNWTNDTEIDEVISIVKRLLPPNSKTEGLKRIAKWHIGIVTPYHAQNYKITQALQALNMGKVDVGTAESFQGKEKPVMIISTVRSASEPFNFEVSDPEIIDCVAPFAKSEWLNTVVNRAKCLVVVSGDPQMLKHNPKWLWLIERCIKHGSFVGDYMSFYSENIQE